LWGRLSLSAARGVRCEQSQSARRRLERREDASSATPIFQGLEYELSGGQQQLLLRLSNFHGLSRIPREAANGVLALLKDGAAD
jgi:hypothetical protein